MTIIPDGLLMTNAGHFGELCRGQTLLPEVGVEAHDRMVTEPDTRVNEMLDDTTVQNLYRDSEMDHPNRLNELMTLRGLTGVAIAKAAGTSKQQIHKLRYGDRKMTREWAEKLAPALGVSWPEVMGWVGELPKPPPDPGPIRQATGARIAWVRGYRGVEPAEAARRFGIPSARLAQIEAGRTELTMTELATLSAKLQVPTDFLLMGMVEELPHRMALEWEDYIQEMQSERPTRTG